MPVAVSLGGVIIPPRDISTISISRGRTDEFERTNTGTCEVVVNVSDLSNAIGAVDAGAPVEISLENAAGGGYELIFVGVVDEINFEVDPSLAVTRAHFECVDGMDVFNRVELAPQLGPTPRFGYEVPRGYAGQIFYEDAGQLNLRLHKVATECEWPMGQRAFFTGNCSLQETFYSPRTKAMQVISDCCDAEFPGIGMFFIDRVGTARFKGRLSRFNYSDPQYDVEQFDVGHTSTGVAQIRGLTPSRGRSRLINAYQAIPVGIADHRLPDVTFVDTASINQHGLHDDSADGLLMDMGLLGTPNRTRVQECALIAEYYVTNYSQPRSRITDLLIQAIHPSHPNAAATWNLLTRVDVSHVVNLVANAPGVGADEAYFVEGLQYSIRPADPEWAMVDLNLNLSPVAFWETDPF